MTEKRYTTMLRMEAEFARRDALARIRDVEGHLRDLRAQLDTKIPLTTFGGEPVRALAEAVTYTQRYSVAIRAVQLITIDAEQSKMKDAQEQPARPSTKRKRKAP
jgi:hypothetical protein